MPKDVSSQQLALHERAPDTTLTRWLYQELRRAILECRLPPGTRLPATRDFAVQYGISRGTVVTVFEQLQAEGYLIGGSGQVPGPTSGCRKMCSRNRRHNRE
jgi:GntR family transcriptional regulator/MocR family aminotransferase